MTQQRAILTRAALITAAAYEFAEHGYAATSVNTILDTCGCTKGALYFHFASKAELADAVLEEARKIYASIVEPVLADTTSTPLAALRTLVTDIADASRIHTELRAEMRLTLEPHYLPDRPSLVWEGAIDELFTRASGLGMLTTELLPERATRTLSTMIAGQRYMNTILTTAHPSDFTTESFDDLVDVVLAAATGGVSP